MHLKSGCHFAFSVLIPPPLLSLGLPIWPAGFGPFCLRAACWHFALTKQRGSAFHKPAASYINLPPLDLVARFPWPGFRAASRLPPSHCALFEPVCDDALEILLAAPTSHLDCARVSDMVLDQCSVHLHSCVISKDPVLSNKHTIPLPLLQALPCKSIPTAARLLCLNRTVAVHHLPS